MKVFVSWSGDDSREVAELFKDWLRKVIQQSEVWISTHDIGPGERWFTGLSKSLSEISFGVLVVTKSNQKAPWLMFEAGALAKTLDARVTPILCNLDSLDIATNPIGNLNFVKVTKGDFWKLILDVNQSCERPLDEKLLKDSFDIWWPEFEKAYGSIKFLGHDTPKLGKEEELNSRLERIEGALETLLKSSAGRNDILTAIGQSTLDQLRHVGGVPGGYVDLGGIGGGGIGKGGVAVPTGTTHLTEGLSLKHVNIPGLVTDKSEKS